MKPISFLHCADIHLGHLQFNEPQRLLDFAGVFARVAEYALDNRVDFILLSGDFFHKRAINAYTLEQSIRLLAPLKEAGIPVVAIEGNHDKAFYQDKNSWLSFLNNQGYIILLMPHFEEGKLVMSRWDEETRTGSWLDLDRVRVYGVGYLGVTTAGRLEEVLNYLEDKDKDEEGKYTILMLHAAVNRLLGQDLGGIRKEILEPLRHKVNYLALGHIHSRYEIDEWIFNPGSLECVHLDEYSPDNEKGFYHVTIGEKGQQAQYVPGCSRPVRLYSVGLTGSRDPEDAEELVFQKLRADAPSQGALVQVRLQGQIPYSPLNLDIANLTERLKDEFSCLYVEILNHANLPENASLTKGSPVNREDIEQLVFGQLLSRDRLWETAQLKEAVLLVRKVKELALTGEAEEELVRLFLQYGEKLLGDDPFGVGKNDIDSDRRDEISGETGVSA